MPTAPPNLDRVQVAKWESPSGGGTQTDAYPVAIDEIVDALSGRGVYFQPAGGTADEDVLVWRDGDDLKFEDKVTGPKTLTQLATASSGANLAVVRKCVSLRL
jgi:hypothetical protein